MKKTVIVIVLIIVSSVSAFAVTHSFSFDTSTLSFVSGKKENILNSFNSEYSLSYSLTSENDELVEEITALTKKTTYLLFGDFNHTDESSEEYYNRKKAFYSLRYSPKIPEDENSLIGLDINSQEYADDLISGTAIPQIFNIVTELGVIYNSYGDIRISTSGELVISTIVLPNVLIKESSKDDPMKYNYVETNIVMHYYYKKLNDEWKLYYLYGDDETKMDDYFTQVETEESKILAIAPSYQDELSNIYSFDKLKELPLNQLADIYNSNVSSVVFFNSYYNNILVNSANGFFVGSGIVVTTWSFLEKSLINAQYITCSGTNSSYDIEGIITANPETDIAVIKVKSENNNAVKLGNYTTMQVEDPAIIISSRTGVGTVVQKGIMISKDKYLQTSIPLTEVEQGSPLFNQNGEVIGMNTSKSANSSISLAINGDVLKEIVEKFNNIKFEDIEAISFNQLKESYYYVKRGNEEIKNSIPKNVWKKYSQIGDIENTIQLELIKASYEDGIVSLRYKNKINKYISSMQLVNNFKAKLLEEGYKLITDGVSKTIYQNKKYQVIIMDEFDYVIIVMVKL